MAQLWQPVEAELTLMGPKTLIEGKTQSDWKTCFESKWGCLSDRNLILDYASRGKPANAFKKATWFDHPELEGPRGVHLHWDFEKYRIDDFVLITSNGIAQGFEMKTVKSGIGIDALDLFYRTLASLKVNENLSNGREWIQNRIKSVNLSEVQNNPDSRRRLLKLIEVQNWLLSLLSVDPTKITPFFHLAGVTHLLSLELIRLQDHYFENQESWILSSKPNLESIYQYSKDFDDASLSKQIEVLLQDVLLKQQQSSNLLKK